MGKTIKRTAAALTALAVVMSQSSLFASALDKGSKADINWFGNYMYTYRRSQYKSNSVTVEEGGGSASHNTLFHDTFYNARYLVAALEIRSEGR